MSQITQTQTKTEIQLEPRVTAEMLIELRSRLGQSQAKFGVTLRNACNPRNRNKPAYSRKTISALEHDRIKVTRQITAAYYEIMGKLQSIPAGTAGGIIYSVIGQPGQLEDGVLIPRSAKVLQCARPGCTVHFIKTHPRQKYHDPECR